MTDPIRWEVLTRGVPHPETVAVGPDGLLYAGTAFGRFDGSGPVVRIDPWTGQATSFMDTGGRVLGICAGVEELILCDVGLAQVAVVDVAGSRRATVTHADGTRLMRPNGCISGADGGTWFTDSGTATAGEASGAVCYLPPPSTRRRAAVVAARDLVYPNGIGLTPDGTTLFVTLTRDDALVAFDVLGPGRLGPPRLVAGQLRTGPDGLCVTAQETVLVAVTRTSRIVEVQASGQTQILAEAPDVLDMPSHVAVHDNRLLVPSLFGDTIAAGRVDQHGCTE